MFGLIWWAAPGSAAATTASGSATASSDRDRRRRRRDEAGANRRRGRPRPSRRAAVPAKTEPTAGKSPRRRGRPRGRRCRGGGAAAERAEPAKAERTPPARESGNKRTRKERAQGNRARRPAPTQEHDGARPVAAAGGAVAPRAVRARAAARARRPVVATRSVRSAWVSGLGLRAAQAERGHVLRRSEARTARHRRVAARAFSFSAEPCRLGQLVGTTRPKEKAQCNGCHGCRCFAAYRGCSPRRVRPDGTDGFEGGRPPRRTSRWMSRQRVRFRRADRPRRALERAAGSRGGQLQADAWGDRHRQRRDRRRALLVKTIVSSPPTTVDQRRTRRCGDRTANRWRRTPGGSPSCASRSPRVQLEARRQTEGRRRQHFITILSGTHTRAADARGLRKENYGSGTFIVDWDTAQSCPSTTRRWASRRSRIRGSTRAAVTISTSTSRASSDKDDAPDIYDAIYRYTATPGAGGKLRYAGETRLLPRPASVELGEGVFTLHSRWMETARGGPTPAVGWRLRRRSRDRNRVGVLGCELRLAVPEVSTLRPHANWGVETSCAFRTRFSLPDLEPIIRGPGRRGRPGLHTQNEPDLSKAIDGGQPADSRAALRELYTTYGGSVYGRCQYLLRDRTKAEDAMQDVFAKALLTGTSSAANRRR